MDNPSEAPGEGMSRKERRRLERELRKQESPEKGKRSWGKPLGIAAVLLIGLAAVGYGLSAYTGYALSQPGKYDQFAQCLTDQGLEMYGAYWCPNCARQKMDFGNSFRYVNSIECAAGDPEGKAQPELCQEKGVDRYPTWITKDGQRLYGQQKMEQLAQVTGCQLPS